MYTYKTITVSPKIPISKGVRLVEQLTAINMLILHTIIEHQIKMENIQFPRNRSIVSLITRFYKRQNLITHTHHILHGGNKARIKLNFLFIYKIYMT